MGRRFTTPLIWGDGLPPSDCTENSIANRYPERPRFLLSRLLASQWLGLCSSVISVAHYFRSRPLCPLSNSAILYTGAAVPAVGGYSHRSHRGEVVLMVTYSELFQLLMLLVAFAGLIIQICKRK